MTDGASAYQELQQKRGAAPKNEDLSVGDPVAPEKTTKKKTKKKAPAAAKPQPGNIYTALAAAQVDLKEIDADGVNDHFGNRYTTLGGLLGGVRPVLAKHGICISMECDPVWETVETTTQVGDETTTRVVRDMLGHHVHCALYYGMNEQGVLGANDIIRSTLFIPKGGNIQQFGSALTYCRRYLVQSIVAVHTDLDDDGNEASKMVEQPRGVNQVRDHLRKG